LDVLDCSCLISTCFVCTQIGEDYALY
jgi:hypothetical protein